MRENGFRSWLIDQGYDTGTVNSRMSNCVRVDRYEGDLDAHYQEDKCAGLLENLSYTTADELAGREPKHSIPIDGNIINGTATLKQAVRLYTRFLDQTGTSSTDAYNQSSSAKTEEKKVYSVHSEQPDSGNWVRDSYAQFLDYFGLDKTSFYLFGLDNTIFAEVDQAMSQWLELKRRLLENQPVAIRGYGRQGMHTKLYLDLYSFLFGNTKIFEDPTNNSVPKRNLQGITGYRINRNLRNYQCSHIFGHTKNPLLFEAVWNLCFIPKVFDPFTGHETTGMWPEEYQAMFKNAACIRFSSFINDFNTFVTENNIEEKISMFSKSATQKFDNELLRRFTKDALSEWQRIPMF